jgi:subtilase family serine protease
MVETLVRSLARRIAPVAVGVTTFGAAFTGAPSTAAGVVMHPLISDWAFVGSSPTPPTQAQCNAATRANGAPRPRRCFNPDSMRNSYNISALLAKGDDGHGQTIAIVDSFGSAPIASDLNVFDTAFGVQHLCGEANYACQPGDPTFKILEVQGSPPAVAPPPNNGTGLENHNLWALEVSLDVEWAHAVAPKANILLVTTPTAEVLGVQGFPDMMKAEQFVIDHHLASVITQSFGAAEETFGGVASLLNLRGAFEAARGSRVTVLASSGDGGTANVFKTPVKNPGTIPFPSVGWPASDPLVTAVGGTNLCTNAETGLTVDTVSPPGACQAARNPTGDHDVVWPGSGGGYSHVFGTQDWQAAALASYAATDQTGNAPLGTTRAIPDVAYDASPTTGVLVYSTEPPIAGVFCGAGTPCSSGWYVVGGTSAGSPQWAGLIAIANQMSTGSGGKTMGYINPALYRLPGSDFFDVTIGKNQTDPSIPGYKAAPGWDPATGRGTPDAAKLIPDLIADVNSH